MKKNKVLKSFGFLGLALVAFNAVAAIMNVRKAKELYCNNDVVVTFGEETIDMSGKGSELDCAVMFGSMILDFRNCLPTEKPMEINLFAKFGSVEIIVPEGWYVESKGKITMAGIENFTATYEDEEPSMLLRFKASFAGISVKNVRYS